MKVEVDFSQHGYVPTQSIAKDAVLPDVLETWIEQQERAGHRYIVFPTTEQMENWRTSVLTRMLAAHNSAITNATSWGEIYA
jgi:hypothetical protein